MRAVLYVVLLMAALWCVVGALGLTAYLLVVAGRSLRDRRLGVQRVASPAGRGVVALLIGYACVMTVIAAAMVWAQVVFWVVMASWSAPVAVVAAAMLRRRQVPTAPRLPGVGLRGGTPDAPDHVGGDCWGRDPPDQERDVP